MLALCLTEALNETDTVNDISQMLVTLVLVLLHQVKISMKGVFAESQSQ